MQLDHNQLDVITVGAFRPDWSRRAFGRGRPIGNRGSLVASPLVPVSKFIAVLWLLISSALRWSLKGGREGHVRMELAADESRTSAHG